MNMADAQLTVGAHSEVGCVRDENQDRMSGDLTPVGNLYIVADGMGGYEGGALAAELAVGNLRKIIGSADTESPVEALLISAFKNANRAIYEKSYSSGSTIERMGSTAVLLLISGQVARVAHVGDSRAYLFRNGLLSRLTIDHTRVQRMVESGMLSLEEAEHHPESHILERAIGIYEDVAVDISAEMAIENGDAFLLCSDGLSGYVSDDEIESMLNSNATVQEVPELLTRKALDKGGHDNITIQFVQYGERQSGFVEGANIYLSRKAGKKKNTRKLFLLSLLLGILIFWVFFI